MLKQLNNDAYGLKVNDLVWYLDHIDLGIGCISKVYKTTCKVNFGLDQVNRVLQSLLIRIDTSECKTISLSDLQRKCLTNKLDEDVIIGNELKHWVGIGLVTERVITLDDLKKYRRVI